MTVISNSVEIRCTPEQAFDYLSDHRSELEWNPGIESIDKAHRRPGRPGHQVPGEVEERAEGR